MDQQSQESFVNMHKLCLHHKTCLWAIIQGSNENVFFILTDLYFLINNMADHLNRVPLTVLGDPNPIDQYPVRNTKGASVGRVVGDGMSLLHNNESFIDWEGEVESGVCHL
jgi:hypothetical protein